MEKGRIPVLVSHDVEDGETIGIEDASTGYERVSSKVEEICNDNFDTIIKSEEVEEEIDQQAGVKGNRSTSKTNYRSTFPQDKHHVLLTLNDEPSVVPVVDSFSVTSSVKVEGTEPDDHEVSSLQGSQIPSLPEAVYRHKYVPSPTDLTISHTHRTTPSPQDRVCGPPASNNGSSDASQETLGLSSTIKLQNNQDKDLENPTMPKSCHETEQSLPSTNILCSTDLGSSPSVNMVDISQVSDGENSRKFRNHQDRNHSDYREKSHRASKFACEVCSREFATFSSLKRHQIIHGVNSPFNCDICDVRCTSSAKLKVHMRSHTGDKPYRCQVCLREFSASYGLKRHQLTHSGDKPFMCEVCAKGFNAASSLQAHMRIHSGEKPFSCDVCSRQFTTSTNLKKHQTVHSGGKRCKCDVCAKTYSTTSNLKVHMRTHTGEKPFNCKLCGKEFTFSSNFKTHLRTHTG